MPRKRYAEDLSIAELRRLIIEKQRAERQARLEHYRRSGRVVAAPPPLETVSTPAGPPAEEAAPPPARPVSPRKRWVDRLLYVVELAAVVGLLVVLLNGLNVLRSLNQEVASVLELPTLTPTALIQAVVLPSGHTPPNAPGGVRFNEAEIPEHLRPLVQSIADLPLPTPGPQQAMRIQIPAIGVDAPVVQGDGYEQLKKGVGTHIGSPNPGQAGNMVLSAHNDVFGEIFRDLDRLKNGDQIILFTSQQTYTYVVRQTQIVAPTQTEVMAPSPEAVVTLISCYPYLVDTERIVVSASYQP